MRKNGFYWVKICGSRWVVAEFDKGFWHYQGGSYNTDKVWEKISEIPLELPI
jgi:hypothetical protein